MKRLFLSFGLVLGLLTFAHSQSYTYRDPQGCLVITNDLSKVPPDQRPGTKERHPPVAQADSHQRAAAPFEGHVVKVLDGQTLQVLRQGSPVTVRVRDIPTHVSKERIRELVGQQIVTVIVSSRTPDGMFVGEVILPTGDSLSEVADAEAKAASEKAQEQIIAKAAAEKRAPRQVIAEEVARIRSRSLPSDYRAKIDTRFVALLKDPDSRKIAYLGIPHGGAVCGTINARNSYGGYTGRQVFLAYFDASGSLEELKIYKDDELRLLRDDSGLEGQLVRRCGLIE